MAGRSLWAAGRRAAAPLGALGTAARAALMAEGRHRVAGLAAVEDNCQAGAPVAVGKRPAGQAEAGRPLAAALVAA